MNNNIIKNITTCKQSLENVKNTLLAEINNNMSKGIFEVPTHYKKLITFSNDSIAFLDEYITNSNDLKKIKKENKADAINYNDEFKETIKNAEETLASSTPDVVEELVYSEEAAADSINDSSEDLNETDDYVPETQTVDAENDVSHEDLEFSKFFNNNDDGPNEIPTDEDFVSDQKLEPEIEEEPVMDPVVDEDPAQSPQEPEEEDVPKNIHKAEIIGSAVAPKIVSDTHPFDSIQFGEKALNKNEFIYNTKLVTMSRGDSVEEHEIFLYIAPLQLTMNSANVPIMVHAYCDGRQVTASSYDTKGDAKRLVQIEINDFHLLCRGAFDNGEFKSYVCTCGISSDQNDSLSVRQQYGGAKVTREDTVGHLKFRAQDTLFEIFPISMTDNEYITIAITKEFIDYEVVASTYGTHRPKFDVDGEEKELIAYFEGDRFIAELI